MILPEYLHEMALPGRRFQAAFGKPPRMASSRQHQKFEAVEVSFFVLANTRLTGPVCQGPVQPRELEKYLPFSLDLELFDPSMSLSLFVVYSLFGVLALDGDCQSVWRCSIEDSVEPSPVFLYH